MFSFVVHCGIQVSGGAELQFQVSKFQGAGLWFQVSGGCYLGTSFARNLHTEMPKNLTNWDDAIIIRDKDNKNMNTLVKIWGKFAFRML